MSGRKSRTDDEQTPSAGPLSDVAAAEYLAEILPELVEVAGRGGLDLVAALLEMARIESTSVAIQPPPGKTA